MFDYLFWLWLLFGPEPIDLPEPARPERRKWRYIDPRMRMADYED